MELSKTLRACLLTGVVTAGVTAAAGPGFAVAAIDKVQNVFVTNDTANPIPVAVTNQPAPPAAGQRVPFQKEVGIVQADESRSGSSRVIDVPAGERLTVTNIAGATSPENPLESVGLQVACDDGDETNAGPETFVELHPMARGALQVLNQATTFEVASGECLFAAVYRQDISPRSIRLTLTGYTTKTG